MGSLIQFLNIIVKIQTSPKGKMWIASKLEFTAKCYTKAEIDMALLQ